jgi:predicted dehydrogenase
MVRIHGGDMVKVILVGHGYFGSLYRERINKHDNLKLVGVVDKDLSRLVKFRGTNLGESYEMCADSIDHDAVIVCTPPQHHASISISALERGKNVLCMKPGAMSEAEAEAVTKAVNVGNGRFFVDYTMLHAPELDFVTGLIGMVGSIGGFSSARHVVTGPKPEGIVRDLLCHDVALLEHLGLTSGDLKVTCAMTSGVSATAIITSPNGERIAYMNASYNSTYARKDTRFKAENMRSVTNPGLVVTWDQNQKSVSVASQGKSIDVQFRHDPDLITRSLNTLADPWYSLLIEGQEYRRIMRIIHALHHSADNDGIVISVAS